MLRIQAADLARLLRMTEAAREAQRFAANRSRSDLDDDRQLLFALAKAVEILGEAAFQICQELREEQPQIAWAQIIGMRHRLVHAFHDTNLDVLWETVIDDMPPLIAELERMLEAAEEIQESGAP